MECLVWGFSNRLDLSRFENRSNNPKKNFVHDEDDLFFHP